MISSGALPNVAFRKPPTPAPVWCAACSVASPISHASGIRLTAASTKSTRRPRVHEEVDRDRERREAERRHEDAPRHGPVRYDAMVDAVLFAWGHTLTSWAPDDEPREDVARLGSTTHALLEALRNRGLKLGVVSNASDPPAAPPPRARGVGDRGADRLRRLLLRAGVQQAATPRSSSARSPRSASRPEAALFVGDRLYEDVRGASELGMTTVQALWFRADDHPDGARAGLPGVHADGRPERRPPAQW